jgi:putative peptidoglycan lipid II flippase
VRAALTGIAVNVILKILLMGPLAQVGLALATAIGAWVNLLLVIGFAVRAGFLVLDRALMGSLARFVMAGVATGIALWCTARFASPYFAQLGRFHDEASFGLLIVVGAIVYGAAILLMFGRAWLRSLVRA